MAPAEPDFPTCGKFLQSVRESSRALRLAANVRVSCSIFQVSFRTHVFFSFFLGVHHAHARLELRLTASRPLWAMRDLAPMPKPLLISILSRLNPLQSAVSCYLSLL